MKIIQFPDSNLEQIERERWVRQMRFAKAASGYKAKPMSSFPVKRMVLVLASLTAFLLWLASVLEG